MLPSALVQLCTIIVPDKTLYYKIVLLICKGTIHFCQDSSRDLTSTKGGEMHGMHMLRTDRYFFSTSNHVKCLVKGATMNPANVQFIQLDVLIRYSN